jgi:hypothetical protein
MLVLKRKSLETAVTKLTKQIADGETAVQKAQKEQVTKFEKTYIDGFATIEKELAKAYADFAKVQKELPKLAFEEAVEKLDAIPSRFDIQGSTSAWMYRDAVKRHSMADTEKKLTTLKGLLSLMDGPELQMTNALAEKFLGKMDILGLLS